MAEGELAKAGERMAEYQTANRDLTAQAEESRQQLQVPALIRCQDCMVLLRSALAHCTSFPKCSRMVKVIGECWWQFSTLDMPLYYAMLRLA